MQDKINEIREFFDDFFGIRAFATSEGNIVLSELDYDDMIDKFLDQFKPLMGVSGEGQKPLLVERYACDGSFSHWALINHKDGSLLWSEAPEEELMGEDDSDLESRLIQFFKSEKFDDSESAFYALCVKGIIGKNYTPQPPLMSAEIVNEYYRLEGMRQAFEMIRLDIKNRNFTSKAVLGMCSKMEKKALGKMDSILDQSCTPPRMSAEEFWQNVNRTDKNIHEQYLRHDYRLMYDIWCHFKDSLEQYAPQTPIEPDRLSAEEFCLKYGYTKKQWVQYKKSNGNIFTYSNATLIEVLEQYASQASEGVRLNLDFVQWYSGMDREKIQSAYQRYLKEQTPPKPKQ